MKLSAYTIAKNCSDLTDVEAGIEELKNYFHQCETDNKPICKTAYIRFYKLMAKKDKYKI